MLTFFQPSDFSPAITYLQAMAEGVGVVRSHSSKICAVIDEIGQFKRENRYEQSPTVGGTPSYE
ncbi:MAG: hypothetical protein V7L11_26895 [Nostoc sp.]